MHTKLFTGKSFCPVVRILSVFLVSVFLCFSLLSVASVPASAENSDESQPFSFCLNTINSVIAEGHCALYTPEWGHTIRDGNSYTDLSWHRVAVFDWDEHKETYVVKRISLNVGSSVPKDAVIPENGFVIVVNLGNDYSASGGINYTNPTATQAYNAFEGLCVGAPVWLTGVDLEEGTIDAAGLYYGDDFVTNARIWVFGEPEEETYQPDTALERVQQPQATSPSGAVPDSGTELTWKPSDDAQRYLVSLIDTTVTECGPYVFSSREVAGTTCGITADDIESGRTYRAEVIAAADGKRSSEAAVFEFYVVRSGAEQSIFADKKVVAYGDSLTALPGWVTMMRGEIASEVINHGVGGDTTTLALKRLDSVLAENADLVIVNFGMNDAAQYVNGSGNLVPLRLYEANYRKIIEALLDAGSAVVLVTPHAVCTEPGYYVAGGYGLNYASDNFSSYVETVRKLAEEYKTGLVDIYALSAGEDQTKFLAAGDGVHQSGYGHEKYCEWISAYLLENYTSEGDFKTDSGEDETSGTVSAESNPDQSPDTDNGSASGNNTALIIIISAAVILVAAGIVFAAVRSRRKG